MELFRHSAGPLSKRLPAPRLHGSPQQHVDRERETEAERRTHGGDDGDHEIFALPERARNLLADVGLRDFDVVLWGAVVVHEVHEVLFSVSG